MKSFLVSLPRWYVATLIVLGGAYLCLWGLTIREANIERANGAEYVMPVGPHDSWSYAELSKSLVRGTGFVQPGQSTETFLTPGYPAFVAICLSLFAGSFFAVTFLQILMLFGIALMTVALGTSVFNRKIGLLASLLFLINPLAPSIAIYILTDTLFAFLLTLGFLILVLYTKQRPYQTALIVGILFGLAAYVRPVGFIAFPIFSAVVLATQLPLRKKLATVLLLLLTISVLLLPWMVRNQHLRGVFGFSSLVELNLAYYTLPHFWNWHDSLPLEQGIERVERESGVARGTNELGYPANWYDLASSPALRTYEKQVVLQQPFVFGSWFLYNSTGFFLNPAIAADAHPSENLKQLLIQGHWVRLVQAAATPWWLLVERIMVLCGILLLVFGTWRLRKNRYALAFAFIILYLAALSGTAAQARYRLPVEPLLYLLISSGFLSLFSMDSFVSRTLSKIISWAARTPLLNGIRGKLGGRLAIRAIEAKRGTVVYYQETDRAPLLDHYREIKRKTRILLTDVEAMQISDAVRATMKVPGAIGEVGTFRGGSTRLMAEASEGKKDIHTFDTFEGLPPLEAFDDSRFSAGQFATGEEEVREYLSPFPRVHIYRGLFPDSAGPITEEKFSFVHLDVDIYSSTKAGIEFFYPRMSPGAMLISHDYSNAEGVHRAFDEFFADKPEPVLNLSGSQCLVVKI